MSKPLIGPRLVMPAIYRFTFGRTDKKEEEKWGWHRAVDILEAVNEIRRLNGKPELSAHEVALEYRWVNPGTGYYSVVDGDIKSNGLFDATRWLEISIREDAYLPAKIGVKLIGAVTSPFTTVKQMVRKQLNK